MNTKYSVHEHMQALRTISSAMKSGDYYRGSHAEEFNVFASPVDVGNSFPVLTSLEFEELCIAIVWNMPPVLFSPDMLALMMMHDSDATLEAFTISECFGIFQAMAAKGIENLFNSPAPEFAQNSFDQEIARFYDVVFSKSVTSPETAQYVLAMMTYMFPEKFVSDFLTSIQQEENFVTIAECVDIFNALMNGDSKASAITNNSTLKLGMARIIDPRRLTDSEVATILEVVKTSDNPMIFPPELLALCMSSDVISTAMVLYKSRYTGIWFAMIDKAGFNLGLIDEQDTDYVLSQFINDFETFFNDKFGSHLKSLDENPSAANDIAEAITFMFSEKCVKLGLDVLRKK